MEKSRAIELLEHLAWDRDIERNPYGDALNMAIEALKAQLSCEGTTSDLITRQQAIDVIEDYPHGNVWNVESMEEMVDKIKALPTAQPEYEPVPAEDFAKTMSENTLYNFMAWNNVAFTLMNEMGFVICKKTI